MTDRVRELEGQLDLLVREADHELVQLQHVVVLKQQAITTLQRELEELKRKYSECTRALDTTNLEQSRERDEMERLRTKVGEQERELAALRQKVREIPAYSPPDTTALDSCRREVETLKKQLTAKEKAEQDAKAEIQSLQAKIAELRLAAAKPADPPPPPRSPSPPHPPPPATSVPEPTALPPLPSTPVSRVSATASNRSTATSSVTVPPHPLSNQDSTTPRKIFTPSPAPSFRTPPKAQPPSAQRSTTTPAGKEVWTRNWYGRTDYDWTGHSVTGSRNSVKMWQSAFTASPGGGRR